MTRADPRIIDALWFEVEFDLNRVDFYSLKEGRFGLQVLDQNSVIFEFKETSQKVKSILVDMKPKRQYGGLLRGQFCQRRTL